MQADGAAEREAGIPAMSHAALFVRFLRFGFLAFGGPVAQIAMIRRELVDEERWISSARFNRMLAVFQVLPGPEAHELCVHLGVQAKGRWGGVLAGLGFMLPGLLLMLAAAWAYTRLPVGGALATAMFGGVQAAVLAVMLRAVHRIGEHILLERLLIAVAVGAALAMLAGVSFWIVLPASGLAYVFAASGRYRSAALTIIAAVAVTGIVITVLPDSSRAASAVSGPATMAALFLAGLKGGLLTFGGAYTAIPFVRADTAGRGWISDAQFLDGVGIAGVLPAPLVIFATFVGWISGGPAGALAITAGMFLPAFAFSLLFYERLEAVVENQRLQLFLAGVAAAVVGVIAVTLVELARGVVGNAANLVVAALVFVCALVVMYRWKSKLATPVVLGIGALVGALTLSGAG
ncbi:MAG: chrA [Sphingomonas bacterium]|nr:chrA [Sphingomonas bacterium]